tara:strand:+ start:278 stop:541 length:264 start_codon:yes stop_codon:yes gene_type:complete
MKLIQNQAATLHTLALELGIIAEGEETHLKEGSKVDGRAFRLALLKPNSTAHHRHPLGDYLGMTMPETGAALGHLVTALRATKNAQR